MNTPDPEAPPGLAGTSRFFAQKRLTLIYIATASAIVLSLILVAADRLSKRPLVSPAEKAQQKKT